MDHTHMPPLLSNFIYQIRDFCISEYTIVFLFFIILAFLWIPKDKEKGWINPGDISIKSKKKNKIKNDDNKEIFKK